MLSALQSGTTLIVDRYSYSGVVFTAAKELPGLDLSWCKVLTHQLGLHACACINAALPCMKHNLPLLILL